jgi:archaellum component FlaC
VEGVGTEERRTDPLEKEVLPDVDPPSPFQYQENISTEHIPTSATPNLSTSKPMSTQQFQGGFQSGISPPQTTISVDFSSLQSFMETNFQMLASKIGSLESRLDNMGDEFSSYKNETNAALNSLQERVNTLTSTVMDVTPKLALSISTMQQQLDFTTGSMMKDQAQLNATLKDIRDNSDRVCLSAGLPDLNTILQEIAKENRKRAKMPQQPKQPPPQGHKFNVPPHFNRSKPFRPRQAKKTAGPSQKSHVHISSDSDSSESSGDNFKSKFPKEEQNPYEDRPRSESE